MVGLSSFIVFNGKERARQEYEMKNYNDRWLNGNTKAGLMGVFAGIGDAIEYTQ